MLNLDLYEFLEEKLRGIVVDLSTTGLEHVERTVVVGAFVGHGPAAFAHAAVVELCVRAAAAAFACAVADRGVTV